MDLVEQNDDIPECWISRGLSEKSREVAREKLHETNDRQSECLTQLRLQLERYAASHTNLTFPRRDDRFLTCFLRRAEYDVDKAMFFLKKYTKFRSKNKELLEGVTPESFKSAFKTRSIMALPQRDLLGRRVMVFRLSNVDQRKTSPLELQRLTLYMLDSLIQDEESQVNGFVVLMDYVGVTMTTLSHMETGELLEKNMGMFGDAHPAFFKEFHLINQPWYFSTAKSAIKSHLTGDMKQRVS